MTQSPAEQAARSTAPTLLDLLEDGIHLLILLRNGNRPRTFAAFNQRIDAFLHDYMAAARRAGKPAEAAEQVRYAYCAVLDELILSSDFPLRAEWERMPLQLRLFGEHLAGEGFFERLDHLRLAPVDNIETLEVFHACLQLGFRGRYLLDGSEKVRYLQRTLQQEIERVRGQPLPLAPHWQLTDVAAAPLRARYPLWMYMVLLVAVGASFFVAYRILLDRQVHTLFGL